MFALPLLAYVPVPVEASRPSKLGKSFLLNGTDDYININNDSLNSKAAGSWSVQTKIGSEIVQQIHIPQGEWVHVVTVFNGHSHTSTYRLDLTYE